jgi:chromosome segregation ATPase
MPRVSLASIEVLEDLLREVRLVHERLQTARNETCRHHELKMEELDTSFREAANRLDEAVATESRLTAEISSTKDTIDFLNHEIGSLESEL